MITDYDVLAAMERFGGSFVASLSRAARMADSVNLAKIKATWPELWAECEDMARIEEQRHDAALIRQGAGDAMHTKLAGNEVKA